MHVGGHNFFFFINKTKKLNNNNPASLAILVGYVFRNPAATYSWFDDFVQRMDKVRECNRPNIVLLGDFNTELLKPQPLDIYNVFV